MKTTPVIVALDFDQAAKAQKLVTQLNPQDCRLKIGKELFVAAGPQLVEKWVAQGFDIFLDLKFHDIPNTVAKACQVAADLGVWMMNVHTSGGPRMMEAAANALAHKNYAGLLIGVTLLTSMDEADLKALGIAHSPAEQVMHLAGLAKEAGLDGVVSSAWEVAALKQAFGQDFVTVTPGIRPTSAQVDDQKRIMTPQQALAAGSDYLVIGRPITQAANPAKALAKIQAEISA